MTIGDLVGEPTLLDWTTDSGMQTVPALRTVLMDYRQVTHCSLARVFADGEPPSLNALHAARHSRAR